MQDLGRRVAFITGGASGIGLAFAEALLKQGSSVVLADIDGARLATVAEALDGDVLTCPLDVTDREGWAEARRAAEGRYGQVDILCNNAGIGGDGRALTDMSPQSFDRVIRINLTGSFNGIATFVRPMTERGYGHVVNVASMSGLLARPTLAAYGASKFGLVGMSECLRQEVAPHGVGVTIVCPGRVRTRISETTRAAGSERPSEAILSTNRSIEAAQVAQMMVQAVLDDRPLVVTHPEFRADVEARAEEIIAAFD